MNTLTVFFQNTYVASKKGHSTEHCLLFMLDRLKKALDKGLCTGILLTDLSTAFDSISHDLLIAKLNAYGFSNNLLNIINDDFKGRRQRTKIDESFSTRRNIIHGVPQGSVLGTLLFNIYINDLFLFSESFEIANYADDCSPYECSGSIDAAVSHILTVNYLKSYIQRSCDRILNMHKHFGLHISSNT